MRFKYCPECGEKLILKEIGDEGEMPYCQNCVQPLFDMFATCVIVLVVNEDNRVLLLRQEYISNHYYNLVSGYMKPGESAEQTAYREVLEEVGIKLENLNLAGTFWFDKKGILMIGFIGTTKSEKLKLSCEVDSAEWFSLDEAITLVHPKETGSVSYVLLEKYING